MKKPKEAVIERLSIQMETCCSSMNKAANIHFSFSPVSKQHRNWHEQSFTHFWVKLC